MISHMIHYQDLPKTIILKPDLIENILIQMDGLNVNIKLMEYGFLQKIYYAKIFVKYIFL